MKSLFNGMVLLPERKWIMVDTTWQSNRVRYGWVWTASGWTWKPLDYGNSRAFLRFDARSYYWSVGVMHYTWAW